MREWKYTDYLIVIRDLLRRSKKEEKEMLIEKLAEVEDYLEKRIIEKN